MKEGPDIALLGSLIGDPARANMLTALMSGKALTATELAVEAGVTQQTASTHLRRLLEGGLIRQRKQGRHSYVSLADEEIGHLLEAMMGVAAKRGHVRARTGPKDPALRRSRVCYDHLAGELGVRLFDSLVGRGAVTGTDGTLNLTPYGSEVVRDFGIDPDALKTGRRPLCRSCLDWSARRSHLAGTLGAAFLQRIYERGWAKRDGTSRIVAFTRQGEARFLSCFQLPSDADTPTAAP